MTHERISPTAWLVAYQRSRSDIPLAAEMFHELAAILEQSHAAPEIDAVESLKSDQMGVLWEARFKMVTQAVRASGLQQVLEAAAGFSSRGLALAQAGLTYVEMDLPGVVADKQRMVQALAAQGRLAVPPSFHLVAGNALSRDDWQAAARVFPHGPLAVVHEGLLPYLDRAERATLAGHVRALLERYGGVWITPDVDIELPGSAQGLSAQQVQERAGKVQALTGIDVLKERFASEAATREFFESCGFQVERHGFREVWDQLVLPKTAPLAAAIIDRSVLFVMRLKD